MSKVWFITGTSKGFGRIWAEAAMTRGDRVAATARDASTLDDLAAKYGDLLLPIELNVDIRDACIEAVHRAHAHFGGLDIVVNNAGYGHFGAIEEVTEVEARQQMETNLFGALWVTQGALPFLRAQGSGHILQVSSIGGVNAFPLIGLYHASKWALEGFSTSLAKEVEPHGIHVTLIEPGGYDTEWRYSSAVTSVAMPEYDHAREAQAARRASTVQGDPEATGAAILQLVDADKPPLRIFFGRYGLDLTRNEYASRIAEWEAWDDVSQAAQGN